MAGARGSDDRGDIVLGWLTRLVVVLGLGGLLAVDGASLLSTRVHVEDAATQAARAAADAWPGSGHVQVAYDAAVASLTSPADSVQAPTFRVTPGGTVTLTVDTTASTLLVRRIGPLRPLTRMSATGTGTP